jgi:hypothetical protein
MSTESACGTSLAVRVIPCLDVDAGRVVKGATRAIRWSSPPLMTPKGPTS